MRQKRNGESVEGSWSRQRESMEEHNSLFDREGVTHTQYQKHEIAIHLVKELDGSSL